MGLSQLESIGAVQGFFPGLPFDREQLADQEQSLIDNLRGQIPRLDKLSARMGPATGLGDAGFEADPVVAPVGVGDNHLIVPLQKRCP